MKFCYVRYLVLGIAVVSGHACGVSQSPSTSNQNLFPSQINETNFVISSPGAYVLRDTVNFTAAGIAAITIQSSHVTIEFDRKALHQSNGLSEGIGIYIADGYSDILLRGGTISNFKDHAIYVGKGCSQIMFNQMELVGSNTVIYFDGEIGSDIFDCSIQDCVVSQGLSCGFLFNYCNNTLVRDTFFLKNQEMGSCLDNCQNMKFTSCYFNNTESLIDAYGMKVLSSDNILFDSCVFNSGIGGLATYGLYMQDGDVANILNCSACGNESDSDVCAGIYLKDSNSIMISSCQTTKNTSTEGAASGICLDGCTGCQLMKCATLSNSCSTTAEYACGIRLEHGSRNYIDSAYISNNVNSEDSDLGMGIYIDSTEDAAVVRLSQSYSNSGYGIKNDSSSSVIVQSATAGNATINFAGAAALSFYKTGTTIPQAIFGLDNVQFVLS